MKNTAKQTGFRPFAFSAAIGAEIQRAGFKQPTAIQTAAIPEILAGRDVLARADTGSGKTAAFILPLLENLSHPRVGAQAVYSGAERARSNSIQILILVPTRELALQVEAVVRQFARHLKPEIRCSSVYGGVRINPQMMALRSGADLLVATPGRLLDLVDQNAVRFNRLKALVVDEVDRLMKGDFEVEISRIRQLLPNQRQNLMFSATLPESIRPIVRDIMRDPVVIDLDESHQSVDVDQRVVTVNHDRKNDVLAQLLTENDWQQVLVFCSAKRTCDNLVIKLAKRGIASVAMHGNKEQKQRARALQDFRDGRNRILIATDVASRGIDIELLPCVINYDLPRSPKDYLHRIGRTARAGRGGQAISLIAHHEYQHFSVIEKHNDIQLPRQQVPGFEADETPPPIPKKNGTRKKIKARNKAKLSKRQRAKLQQKSTGSVVKKPAPSMATEDREPEARDEGANNNVWGKAR